MKWNNKKVYITLALLVLISVWWFLKGYFFGHEIIIWFKPEVTHEHAQLKANELNGYAIKCSIGKDFSTKSYLCYLKIETNSIDIRQILLELKATPIVYRAEFYQDLIAEYRD